MKRKATQLCTLEAPKTQKPKHKLVIGQICNSHDMEKALYRCVYNDYDYTLITSLVNQKGWSQSLKDVYGERVRDALRYFLNWGFKLILYGEKHVIARKNLFINLFDACYCLCIDSELSAQRLYKSICSTTYEVMNTLVRFRRAPQCVKKIFFTLLLCNKRGFCNGTIKFGRNFFLTLLFSYVYQAVVKDIWFSIPTNFKMVERAAKYLDRFVLPQHAANISWKNSTLEFRSQTMNYVPLEKIPYTIADMVKQGILKGDKFIW